MEPSKAKNKYSRLVALIGVLFILGITLRLFDVTDPPLDFHAWRQLRSASIARKLYYDVLPTAGDELQEKASQLGSFEPLEPPIFERMVALAYRLAGQEQLWIARVLAIVTWVLGGLPLYLLARRLTSRGGAVVSLAYYLFLPFTVIVRWSFLPDVPMTVMVCRSIYIMFRRAERPTIVFDGVGGRF